MSNHDTEGITWLVEQHLRVAATPQNAGEQTQVPR
jgi:UTP:GlnB (protein PII) uridylyltransferase